MELREAIVERHSVRQFIEQPIDNKRADELSLFVDQCNRESGLSMQLVLNEPQAFAGGLAKYGKFSGVTSYLAIIGKKGRKLDEKAGYYGEKFALRAQQLGLNTCWVGLTFKKIKDTFIVGEDEKLVCVIAVGYGANEGHAHKIKTPEQVCDFSGSTYTEYSKTPEWFQKGVEAALLAPTAINQQKFTFSLNGNRVRARVGRGFFSKVDLGIVKYHFEIGAAPKEIFWG